MAGRSRFGRKRNGDDDEQDEQPKRQPEGVRVLEPEQAAQAAEKETAVKRRPSGAKPGDVPAPSTPDNKPAIRLPLARATSLDDVSKAKTPNKPAPAGQQRLIDPTGQVPRVEATDVSIGQPVLSESPPIEPPAEPPVDLDPKPPKRSRAKVTPDAPDAEDDAVEPLEPLETLEAGDRLSVDPPTGEVQLPHWTEPATGEVPKIIIGDTPAEAPQDAWDAFAGSSPRYRDQHDSWDDASVADLLDDDAERLGALSSDVSDQTQDEFLSFDDVEIPDLQQPVPPARGSSYDPVRQGKAGRATGSTPVVRATKRVPGRAADEQEARPERRVSTPPRARETGEHRGMGDKLGVTPAGADSGKRNWKVAALVGVPMAAIALLIFNLPRWFPSLGNGVAVALIIIVVFLCGSEFMAAVTTRRFKPLLPVGWAALIAMPLAAYHFGDVAIPMVLFLSVFVGFGFYLTGLATEKPLRNLGVTFFTIVYIAMFGSFASLILRIGPVLQGDTITEGAQGASILVLAITSAVLSDAGAALFGNLYGKRSFTPISPNKTIQGVLGGVVVSTVITGILALEFGPFHGGGFFFAFCCAIAAPIGDLAESLLKRDLGLKDMSELIPGHGGVLDRMDALLFVLPVAYYVTRLLLGPGLPFS
jgi:phosphatidate cytidylyltransferase